MSVIKSIQRGSVELAPAATTNIAISSVNMAKTVVIVSCMNGDVGHNTSTGVRNATMIGINLTSSTNLYAACGTGLNFEYPKDAKAYWQVVEYE